MGDSSIALTGVGLEAPGGDGDGGGGGGGGGLQIKDFWSGNLDFTANQWLAVGATAVPSDATWLLWNGGTPSSGTDDGPAALWTWINATDWRALTADTVGATPGDGTGMLMVDWIATNIGDGTPDFARRDLIIGRTSANVPLLLSTNSSEDVQGGSLKYTTFTEPVATDGGSGILELEENEPLPTPDADSSKFVYRPGQPAQFWIKEEERHSQETGTAGQTHILPGSADYADFQGVLNYQPPVASATLGDYYFDYYYSRRHFYEFAFIGPQLTGANRWAAVAIDDISGDPLGSDAVFIGEATGPHAAILLIDPDEFDSGNKYYYVNVAQRRLYLLTGITLPSDPFISYSYRALNAPVFAEQTGIWYINGQTERWPSTYGYTQAPASSRLRIRWSGDNPNETPYGWDLGSIWPAAISGNIDGSANPANTTSNVVFSPPAGVWDIEATIGFSDETIDDDEFGIFLYEITSGDDKILAATSGRQADMPANFGGVGGTVFRIDLKDVELDGTEQLYVMAFTVASGPNWRGFLSLRKKA